MSSADQLVLPGFEYLNPDSPKTEVGEAKLKAIKISSKVVTQLHELIAIQEKSANQDAYGLGMYNGMELMLAMIEDREPKFRELPASQVIST